MRQSLVAIEVVLLNYVITLYRSTMASHHRRGNRRNNPAHNADHDNSNKGRRRRRNSAPDTCTRRDRFAAFWDEWDLESGGDDADELECAEDTPLLMLGAPPKDAAKFVW